MYVNPLRILEYTKIFKLGPLAFTLVGLIGPLLQVFTSMDRTYDRMTMGFQSQEDVFDFIIVGGGSAGSALANKLSEDFSVLVLEYGGTPSILQDIPIYAFYLYNQPSIDWAHLTVPQMHSSFGLKENRCLWPTGKLLGGSSQLNAMMYIRGNVQGFDEISAKTGDPRWNTSNMLNYYRNLEDYNGWYPGPDHGRGGPVSIERPNLARFTKYFIKAGEELGYPVRDPNAFGPYRDGFAMMDLYMKNGRRSDAYHEFVEPLLGRRRNLVVRRYSYVTRVLFHEGTTQAYGVEYERHGQIYQAKARNEVILSAGSVNSAKLLMLSGIGPRSHLDEIGIHTKVDLPVGQYIQDKFGAIIGPFIVDKGNALRYDRDISLGNMLDWLLRGEGGAFKTALAEGTWAITTDTAKRNRRTTAPDIHTYILSIASSKELEAGSMRSFNVKPNIAEYMAMTKGKDSFLQLVTLNKPLGFGYVKLRDRNPFSPLVIDPKYLENNIDFEALVDGLKFAVKWVEETEAFREVNGHLMPVSIPGCEHLPFKSDSYFRCLARQVTVTAYKYSGTAPIGKDASDPDAVVDSHLRVFGTTGLRVVDGSVLQQKHSSINDITCRMLGTFAGDIIKQDWLNYNYNYNSNNNNYNTINNHPNLGY